MDQIRELIEKEIERRVQEKLTTFIELVSNTYDISMKVLLRDLSRKTTTGNVCMGVTANGKRCKFSATSNGFCKKHLYQFRPPPQMPKTTICCTPIHNHTIPPLFSPHCPACIISQEKRPQDKLLIDM